MQSVPDPLTAWPQSNAGNAKRYVCVKTNGAHALGLISQLGSRQEVLSSPV